MLREDLQLNDEHVLQLCMKSGIPKAAAADAAAAVVLSRDSRYDILASPGGFGIRLACNMITGCERCSTNWDLLHMFATSESGRFSCYMTLSFSVVVHGGSLSGILLCNIGQKEASSPPWTRSLASGVRTRLYPSQDLELEPLREAPTEISEKSSEAQPSRTDSFRIRLAS